MPMTSTFMVRNISMALRASCKETSLGVVTTMAPVSGTVWISEMATSPARRQIDHEVIQFSPFDLPEKLANHRVQHGSAPYQRLVSRVQKSDRDYAQAVALDRNDAIAFGDLRRWLVPSMSGTLGP